MVWATEYNVTTNTYNNWKVWANRWNPIRVSKNGLVMDQRTVDALLDMGFDYNDIYGMEDDD